MCRMATVAGQRTANAQREQRTSRQDTPPPGDRCYLQRRVTPRVTCVGMSVKALLAWGSAPEALVKVERPQRSEDVRP